MPTAGSRSATVIGFVSLPGAELRQVGAVTAIGSAPESCDSVNCGVRRTSGSAGVHHGDMEGADGAEGGVAISVQGLTHRYASPEGTLPVLSDVDLDVPVGGYVAVTGPSGAGKSTLLSVLGGLEALQEGAGTVGEIDLAGLGGDELAAYRLATVGFVFQHFGLLEALTAAENVELASTLARTRAATRRRRAAELLEAVGLADRADHRPLQLSGGERQRVAIARALANRPRLLLADEPTGNLDEGSASTVIELLEHIRAERGCTLLVVTHNRMLAARAPHRVVLDRGRRVA
jgi:putative ABC transport system ATP-binding protein